MVAPRLMPALDPVAGETMEEILKADGVKILKGRATAVSKNGEKGHVVVAGEGGEAGSVEGDVLLISTGRKPVTEGMGLEELGITLNQKGGIQVDAQLRTNVKGVCAAGDCTGDQQFTHYAGFQGGIAARNLLLPFTSKGVSGKGAGLVPGVTYTHPECGHIGMTEREAVEHFGADRVRVVMRPLQVVDRAVCAGENKHGFYQFVLNRASGKLVGATVISPPAGEIISEISVAIKAGMKFADLTLVMHAYPSYALPIQVAASSVYYEDLKKKSRLLSILSKLGF
tara:strand:+ start:165 stop:1016 length:852 start_codon:yes stop_codon:yes gene_type:complete